MFFVIEGQDATGKDTQANLLCEYLKKQGKNFVHYSESGTNSDNEFIRSIAKLNYGQINDIEARSHTLLYLVNRYEQWRKLAEPALRNKDAAILTRYWFSTLIYEGYGSGVSKSLIAKLHHEIMPPAYFKPDHIVILTLPDEERAKRLAAQGKERQKENFKSKNNDFQHKLNHAYLKVAKEYNIPTLDASGTPAEVFAKLRKLWNI